MNLFHKLSKPAVVLLAGSAVLFSIGNSSLATAQPPSAPAQTPAQGAPPQGRSPREPLPPIVPADTLSVPSTPQKLTAIDGFIQRWLILEPIPANELTQNAVQAEVKKQYFPNQFTVLPQNRDKVTVGDTQLTWHAEDTKLYNIDLYQFARALGKPATNALFWVVTVVNAPQEMKDVRLAIGSNAASVWWLNGEEVIGIYGDRQTVIDDGVSKRITLKKGPNILRAAIVNGGGATDFCARFLGSDDKPIKGLAVTLPKP
jgi:hypothetical protein